MNEFFSTSHRWAIPFVLFSILLGICSEALGQSFPFVIPGDDSTPSAVDRSVLLPSEAGVDGFIRVKDGHFYNDRERVRFWGMNLCFAANFPTHEETDLLVPHFAKLGINAIRFHHMDHHAAPNGIWAKDLVNGERVFDPEMVDRLDYFLAKLHEHGIYANLNLHVSRELTLAEGFPSIENAPWWAGSNKWVIYFDPDVQAELKRFCRMLLSHQNPYRGGRSRTDDPGIALIEMLNENYFSLQGHDLYYKLPDKFRKSFDAAWNRWLNGKYSDHQSMIDAWGAAQPEMGEFLVPDAKWTEAVGPWSVNQTVEQLPRSFHNDLPSSLTYSGRVLRFAPVQVTEHNYQQQLLHSSLSVEKDVPLTMSCWVRADQEREVQVELSTSAGGQWRSLGMVENLKVGPKWKQIQRVIFPPESVRDEVNFAFNFGLDKTPIEFCAVTLQEGITSKPLPADMNLARQNVAVPESGWPLQAHQDLKQFLVDTERSWVKELKEYLQQDLGVKVPITASQMNYHPPEIVDELADFADLHTYWHHPMFAEGQDWSATAWTVGNEPMEALPGRAGWPTNSLLMRTGWRWADKPMTLSEWNYSEPSPFSSGAVPTAAALAAIQDWDAIFFFEYDSFMTWSTEDDRPYFRQHTNNFFGFNAQPVKLAWFSQAANLFLRGDLKPLETERVSDQSQPLDGRWAFSHRLGVRSLPEQSKTNLESENRQTMRQGEDSIDSANVPPKLNQLSTPDHSLRWSSQPPTNSQPPEGVMIVDTSKTIGAWGTISEKAIETKHAKFAFSKVQPNYGGVLLSSVDGKTLEECEQAVLLVTGFSENQEMGWNSEKTSVGDQWGQGPTKVTIPAVQLLLDAEWRFKTIVVLDGKGHPKAAPKSIVATDGRVKIEVGPQQQTLWFLLEK